MLRTTVEICFYTTTLTLLIGYVIAYAMLKAPPRLRAVRMIFVIVAL